MAEQAAYPIVFFGVSYAQFAALPALSRTAAASLRRRGKTVAGTTVTASRDQTLNGVHYAPGASMASLPPAQLSRVLRARDAS